MPKYRSTVTEDRIGVGNFTGTFRKGQIVDIKQYQDADGNNTHYDAQDVIDYLLDRGVIIEVDDNAVDNEWYDSEDPQLAGQSFVDIKVQEFAQELADADTDSDHVVVTVEETTEDEEED